MKRDYLHFMSAAKKIIIIRYVEIHKKVYRSLKKILTCYGLCGISLLLIHQIEPCGKYSEPKRTAFNEKQQASEDRP